MAEGSQNEVECDQYDCKNAAYAKVETTDPNGHVETFNLCGKHREEIYENSIYKTKTLEKLKKNRSD